MPANGAAPLLVVALYYLPWALFGDKIVAAFFCVLWIGLMARLIMVSLTPILFKFLGPFGIGLSLMALFAAMPAAFAYITLRRRRGKDHA